VGSAIPGFRGQNGMPAVYFLAVMYSGVQKVADEGKE